MRRGSATLPRTFLATGPAGGAFRNAARYEPPNDPKQRAPLGCGGRSYRRVCRAIAGQIVSSGRSVELDPGTEARGRRVPPQRGRGAIQPFEAPSAVDAGRSAGESGGGSSPHLG